MWKSAQHPKALQRLVERVEALISVLEPLQAGVEVEPTDSELCDEPLGVSYRGLAMPRVHRAEGMSTSAFFPAPSAISSLERLG